MKKIKEYIFPIVFLIFIGLSFLLNFAVGKQIGINFWMFFKEMILFLPLMFILIGLFDVWVPREKSKNISATSQDGKEPDWSFFWHLFRLVLFMALSHLPISYG
ncbi:MAG: hypothetical protein MZU95_17120 [Desulfomicrobium escambiense]|nr:hypothetical protein [Desulfomicrobium escambiense]